MICETLIERKTSTTTTNIVTSPIPLKDILTNVISQAYVCILCIIKSNQYDATYPRCALLIWNFTISSVAKVEPHNLNVHLKALDWKYNTIRK